MQRKTIGKAVLSLATVAAAFAAPATLVRHYDFDSEADLLKATVGEDGKAYDTDRKAPIAKEGNYTLQAVTTNGANAVRIPTGASFGFDHGVGAEANDCYCIEMRVFVPDTTTDWASFIQLLQNNNDDAFLFRRADDTLVGGGNGGIPYTAGSELPLNEWHTYVVSVERGIPSLYKDGKPVVLDVNFNWLLAGRPKFFMAADNDGEDGDVYFDYIKVYDESLPAELGLDPIPLEDGVWTGDSTESENWSEAGNWLHSTTPDSSQKVQFPLPSQRVRLDGDKTVKDFFVKGSSSALFYNDDLTKTNTLTISELDMIGQGGAKVEFNGPIAVTCANKGDRQSKAKLIVSGGASFASNKINFGDDGDQSLIADGEGSKINVVGITVVGYTKANCNESLEAYNGGCVTVSQGYNYKSGAVQDLKPYDGFTVVATNGGDIIATRLDMSYSGATSVGAHKLTCEDSYMNIKKFASTLSGTLFKVGGTGYVVLENAFTFAGSNANVMDLWLTGKEPEVYVKGNSETKFGTGNSTASYKGKVSLNLAPEPTWKEGSGRINKQDGIAAKFTLCNYVTFNVDCSGFANYYGKRRMALFRQEGTTAKSAFVKPTTYLHKSGTGEANCNLDFDFTDTAFYMTITATNAVPPANAVAGVNNAGKATDFYDTLEAAVAAAAAADTDEAEIVLLRDVNAGKLENPGTGKTKNIKIYALTPVKLTTLGKLGAGITIGGNVVLEEQAGLILFVK